MKSNANKEEEERKEEKEINRQCREKKERFNYGSSSRKGEKWLVKKPVYQRDERIDDNCESKRARNLFAYTRTG